MSFTKFYAKMLFAWINDVIYSSAAICYVHLQSWKAFAYFMRSIQMSSAVISLIYVSGFTYLAENRHIAASLHMEIYELWFVKTLNFNFDKSHLQCTGSTLSKHSILCHLYNQIRQHLPLTVPSCGSENGRFAFFQWKKKRKKRKRQATACDWFIYLICWL